MGRDGGEGATADEARAGAAAAGGVTTTDLVPYHGPVELQGVPAARAEVATGRHRRETDADRLAARAEVIAHLLLRGETYRSIGETLGISKSQVGREVAKIRAGWAERTAAAYQDRIDEEDAKLDWLERQWITEAGSDQKAAELLLKIMDRRARLLGLDKPTRIETTLHVDLEEKKQRAQGLIDEVERKREAKAG